MNHRDSETATCSPMFTKTTLWALTTPLFQRARNSAEDKTMSSALDPLAFAKPAIS